MTTSISSHFAVMCVMEDLIGSADAESEAALLAARARAAPQLSALACTMGRDWCENEIVPYLMRIALEDEKLVSEAAAEQVAALCETRYFEQSRELQDALLLSVGVGFLASTHSQVRAKAVVAVRRACAVISASQNKKIDPDALSAAACTLLLRVVHRLFFETAFPASLASGLLLLAPARVSLAGYRCNPGFEVLLSPLVAVSTQHLKQMQEVRISALGMLGKLLKQQQQQQQQQGSGGLILSSLRLEAAVCGGTGRVTLVDQSLVALAKDIVSFCAAEGSNNSNNSHSLLSSGAEATEIVLDHLARHVFTAPCPSAIFLDDCLPRLCDSLSAIATLLASNNEASLYVATVRQQLFRLAARIVSDWSCCDDWAGRFEVAKFAPQIFDSLLKFSRLQAQASREVQLAVELLQTVLPRLVNDEEVEVSTAAAGSLPQVMASAEKVDDVRLRQIVVNSNNRGSMVAADKLAEPSVQEAVATALGAAVRGEGSGGASLSNNSNSGLLSSTAHTALSEMLSACDDDNVRAQIVESLLWSAAVPGKKQQKQTTTTMMTKELHSALGAAINALLSGTRQQRWRTRDFFAASIGKMVAHILQFADSGNTNNNNNLHRIVLQHPGCFEFVVQPFVQLALDRFSQVRASALAQIVAVSSKVPRARREILWAWTSTLQQQNEGRGDENWPSMRHYQTRVARLVLAVVCASEPELLSLLEESARDKVPNVRRAAAQALAQGCSSSVAKTTSKEESTAEPSSPIANQLPDRPLIADFAFHWSAENLSTRVLALLEQLVADESADVRESAAEGLSRCA